MTTVRLLHDVGNDPKGAVISLPDRRAAGLVSTGYAETVTAAPDAGAARKGKSKS